jgi:hypothetical protein
VSATALYVRCGFRTQASIVSHLIVHKNYSLGPHHMSTLPQVAYSFPRAMTKYCACVGPGFLMPCSSFEAT